MTNVDVFIADWNTLERAERKQLRRLVRLGRPIENPRLERLASSYAQYQRSRIWARPFWAWFAPGVIVALGIASQLPPVVVGIVLALGAQAVLTNRNLRRRARMGPAL